MLAGVDRCRGGWLLSGGGRRKQSPQSAGRSALQRASTRTKTVPHSEQTSLRTLTLIGGMIAAPAPRKVRAERRRAMPQGYSAWPAVLAPSEMTHRPVVWRRFSVVPPSPDSGGDE